MNSRQGVWRILGEFPACPTYSLGRLGSSGFVPALMHFGGREDDVALYYGGVEGEGFSKEDRVDAVSGDICMGGARKKRWSVRIEKNVKVKEEK